MAKLRCKHCNYYFESGRTMAICPNCGERGSLFIEQSAEELVRKAD